MRCKAGDSGHEAFGMFKYCLAAQPGEVLENPHVGVYCVLDALFFAAPQVQTARKCFTLADNNRDVPLHAHFLSDLMGTITCLIVSWLIPPLTSLRRNLILLYK